MAHAAERVVASPRLGPATGRARAAPAGGAGRCRPCPRPASRAWPPGPAVLGSWTPRPIAASVFTCRWVCVHISPIVRKRTQSRGVRGRPTGRVFGGPSAQALPREGQALRSGPRRLSGRRVGPPCPRGQGRAQARGGHSAAQSCSSCPRSRTAGLGWGLVLTLCPTARAPEQERKEK